jgi:hypothetical protein
MTELRGETKANISLRLVSELLPRRAARFAVPGSVVIRSKQARGESNTPLRFAAMFRGEHGRQVVAL